MRQKNQQKLLDLTEGEKWIRGRLEADPIVNARRSSMPGALLRVTRARLPVGAPPRLPPSPAGEKKVGSFSSFLPDFFLQAKIKL
jgi:hypothetical protein